MDQAAMERNRVLLLGLNDARALSPYKILRTRVRLNVAATVNLDLRAGPAQPLHLGLHCDRG